MAQMIPFTGCGACPYMYQIRNNDIEVCEIIKAALNLKRGEIYCQKTERKHIIEQHSELRVDIHGLTISVKKRELLTELKLNHQIRVEDELSDSKAGMNSVRFDFDFRQLDRSKEGLVVAYLQLLVDKVPDVKMIQARYNPSKLTNPPGLVASGFFFFFSFWLLKLFFKEHISSDEISSIIDFIYRIKHETLVNDLLDLQRNRPLFLEAIFFLHNVNNFLLTQPISSPWRDLVLGELSLRFNLQNDLLNIRRFTIPTYQNYCLSNPTHMYANLWLTHLSFKIATAIEAAFIQRNPQAREESMRIFLQTYPIVRQKIPLYKGFEEDFKIQLGQIPSDTRGRTKVLPDREQREREEGKKATEMFLEQSLELRDSLRIILKQGDSLISRQKVISEDLRRLIEISGRMDKRIDELITLIDELTNLTRHAYDMTEVNKYLSLLSRLEKEITPEKFETFYNCVLKTDVWTDEEKVTCICALKDRLDFDNVFKKSTRQQILGVIFNGLSLLPGGIGGSIVGPAINELGNFLKGKWNL